MSGRIIVTPFNSQNLLEEKVDLLDELITGFNLAPHQLISIILKDDAKANISLENAFWGFAPSWTKPEDFKKTNFSISLEQTKSSDYKSLVRTVKKDGKKIPIEHFQKPCLVPVTGFLKWKDLATRDSSDTKGVKAKYPKSKKIVFAIRKEANFMFFLAGIWTRYIYDIDFSFQNSFALVNTKATGALSEISPRMPIILDKNSGLEWLKTKDLKNFKASSQTLEFYQVANKINSPENNFKELLTPTSSRFKAQIQ